MKIRPKNGYLLLVDIMPITDPDLDGCLQGVVKKSGSPDFSPGDRVFFPSKHIYRSFFIQKEFCLIDSKAILGCLDAIT